MIYLYDVIHYAHTRTSVPTSARTHKEKKKRYTLTSRTHTCETIHSLAHARVSTRIHTNARKSYVLIHMQAYIYIHTHTRACARGHTYTRTWARAFATHTHTRRVTCVNGDARLTKRVYMSMYARVHIQSTSRMCFTGYLFLSFFFSFYITQNFVTARIIGRKCNRDEQASVNHSNTASSTSRENIFVSQNHFSSSLFIYIYMYIIYIYIYILLLHSFAFVHFVTCTSFTRVLCLPIVLLSTPHPYDLNKRILKKR